MTKRVTLEERTRCVLPNYVVEELVLERQFNEKAMELILDVNFLERSTIAKKMSFYK